jgi:hypothetical protein
VRLSPGRLSRGRLARMRESCSSRWGDKTGDPAWCAAKRANQPGHADQAVVSGHAMGSAPLATGSTKRLSDGR